MFKAKHKLILLLHILLQGEPISQNPHNREQIPPGEGLPPHQYQAVWVAFIKLEEGGLRTHRAYVCEIDIYRMELIKPSINKRSAPSVCFIARPVALILMQVSLLTDVSADASEVARTLVVN